MALNRPAVLVYQEFASLSTTPTTPELNVCVVGACYQLRDYPEDRGLETLAVYGAATAGTLGSVATVSAAAPALTAIPVSEVTLGAAVDTASVVVTLPAPTVQILAGTCTNVINTATLTVGAANVVSSGVAPGDVVWVDLTGGGGALRNIVRSVTASTIVMNNQLTDTTHTKFRVERELSASVVTPSAVTASTVTLPALLSISVSGTPRTVVHAEVFVGFKALRTDLADVASLGSEASILATLGKYDARNPLCVGAVVAKRNTASSVQVYGITSDDAAGFSNMLSQTSSRKDLYAVVPLTSSISVLSSFKTEFNQIADPDYVLVNGLSQKFRVVIGSPGQLPADAIITDKNLDGVAAVGTNTPATNVALTFSGTWTDLSLVTLNVLPGFTISYTVAAVPYTYTIASVRSALTLTVDGPAPVVGAATLIAIKNFAGVTVNVDDTDALTLSAASATFTKLTDPNGTFVDDTVLAGDILEIPEDPADTTLTGALFRFQVAAVASNQELSIVGSSTRRDTSLVANELPHGFSRTLIGGNIQSVDATVAYRVVRPLTKDGQVDALIAAGPVSLADRRAVVCWPDAVDVTDLVDGSLPRAAADVPATAQTQPGFYLACAVGGLTAALPSHHGLTQMGVAGIAKLYNANTYFSDRQLTRLSNNGWMVFQQETPTALPYIIHGLTTDVSALQFGEFMMVKNLDYVSMVYADALTPFVGTWNINAETLGFIGNSLGSVGASLRLDRRAKIGARIKSARVVSLAESTISADRLEVRIEVDFPKPLNIVALHLVSL